MGSLLRVWIISIPITSAADPVRLLRQRPAERGKREGVCVWRGARTIVVLSAPRELLPFGGSRFLSGDIERARERER